jgi:hypothetical protein
MIDALLLSVNARAQESFNASGGDASGSNGSVSYSVGQVFYITKTGTNGSIVDGVQQPYEISVITAIEGTDSIALSIKVFPNPASEYIILSMGGYQMAGLSYQLKDAEGRSLGNGGISDPETTISITELARGIYFLQVLNTDREIKVFKIIKN